MCGGCAIGPRSCAIFWSVGGVAVRLDEFDYFGFFRVLGFPGRVVCVIKWGGLG